MMKRVVLYFVSLFALITFYASSQNLDSIKMSLNKMEPKERMDAYQALIIKHWLNTPDVAMQYAKDAMAFANQQSEERYKAIALRLTGGVYLYMGSYDSALFYSKEANRLSILTGDSTLMSSGFNNIGFTHYHFGNYPLALENLLRALQIKEQIHQAYGLGQTLNNIGLVYTRLKDYAKARQYFTNAVVVAVQQSDKNTELYSFNNIGFTYLEENDLAQAEFYFNKAMRVAEVVDNINWHATTFSGLGQVAKRRGLLEDAKKHFQESLRLREQIGDKRGISEIYYLMSQMELEQGNSIEALNFLYKSQDIAVSAKAKQRILENYELAKSIFVVQKRYDSALYYQTQFTQLRDSLFNENMARELADIQLNLKQEEVNKKLAKKDAELDRKTTVTNYLMVIFLLAVLFSLVLYRSYRMHKELSVSLRKKNEELIVKSKEIVEQKESLVLSNLELKEARERIHVQNLQLEELNRHLQSTVDLRTRELDVASRELRIVSLELDNFIYKSSHDIKGPLVRLLGICHVALLDVSEDKAKEYISMLYDTARHLNDIFDRLKIVSDINATSVNKVEVQLHSLVKSVLDNLKSMEGFDKIDTFMEMDENLQYESDPFLLETIFHNMLENAIRFQKKSAETKKFIVIRIQSTPDGLVTSFIDNGIGINEHDIENMFKMFSKAALEHHNVGLGLYIVKQCVNRLEGTIRIVKNPHGYTEFQIILPPKDKMNQLA